MSGIDTASERRLEGVHPDLVRVVRRAAADGAPSFRVIEGVRSLTRQRDLVARGASKTMNSRHLTGHAVDIVPLDQYGGVSWDWPLYRPLAKAIKAAAKAEGVPIEWGGDWQRFADGPHWQLPWKAYPATPPREAASAEPITERSRSDLTKSRTAQGAFAATAGGTVGLIESGRQITTELQQADGHISSGSILGLVIGAIIVTGSLCALYARWDDAGRPLPWGRE
jgi:peptidoglycan L-alanyl-D-glutamate endopeptidase CwlK